VIDLVIVAFVLFLVVVAIQACDRLPSC